MSAQITNAFDCNNPNSGAIELTISGGTEPYSTNWSNGKTTKDLSNIPAGTYVADVTDANGCTISKTFELTRQLPITLAVDVIPDFNCQTKVLNEICTAQITGGVAPYNYTWSSGTAKGSSNEIMETSQSGIIVLSVIDGLGCSANYTFNLQIADPGIDYKILDCDTHVYGFNAIIPIGLAIDYTFMWDFGDGKTETLQNPEHSYLTPGMYKVILTLKNSICTTVFEKVITVESPPVLVLDKLPIFCSGDSILLHVSGAESYRWYDGSTNDSLLIKKTGDYSVLGTSKAGCNATLNFKVTNFDSYNYTVQTDRDEITTDNPTLDLWSESINYSNYFWDFGDGNYAEGNNQNHTFENLRDGYFDVKLRVRNPNGCDEFATKRIWIKNNSKDNVFTPNGDGVDDVFMKGFHIQAFNRNGILLYDGTDGWDGTYKGEKVSNGTYFILEYTSTVTGIKTSSRFVMVVR
jgi:gliding motility-associated-like protein